MKNKWRMPHPATMFLLLTIAVVFLSWICDLWIEGDAATNR